MTDAQTMTLPLLPLPGVVVPQMVVNLAVDMPAERRALEAAQRTGGRLVLVPHVGGRYARVGTVATIEQVDGNQVLLRGLSRARIGVGRSGDGGALEVEATPVADERAEDPRTRDLAREYRAVVGEILSHRHANRVAGMIAGITDPGALADTAIYSPDLSVEQKVQVLEAVDVTERLQLVTGWARDTLAELSLRERIRDEVGEKMERQQREYLLRQQLAEIRAELGEDDEGAAEGYRKRIAEADLPEHVATAALREVDRLERMGEQNPEHGWVRTWLDTILDIPWSPRSDDRLDL